MIEYLKFARGATFFCLFLIINTHVFSQQPSKNISAGCIEKTNAIWAILQKEHISPVKFTPEVAAEIIGLTLIELDPRQIHFLKSDKQTLMAEIIAAKSIYPKDLCKYVSKIAVLYQNRLKESEAMLQKIALTELKFDESDTIIFSSAGRTFSESNEKRTKRWKRYVKFLVLNEAYSSLDSSQLNNALPPKDLLINKTKTTETIVQKELKKLSQLLDVNIDYDATVVDALLNATCKRFDPHSEYYSYDQFTAYSEHLQSQVLSFGIFFGETSFGNLSISYVAPGSAAWFSNQIQQGDIVLAFKLNQQSFDAVMLTADEADDLLHLEKYTLLELTIKKSSGAIETIKLKKEAIKFESNTVKSFVLKGEKKIGYVSIPSFYTDSNNPNALGCANELSKEILKLKNENIEGLVIDLRFNGGGSLFEAVSMSGLFLDIGPLFYSVDNTAKATLVKDMSRGTVYDGPLFIMVNGYSASASELFSAAMQDNHRALIIGEQTYGKATGQTFSPLDTTSSLSKLSSTDNMGVVKYTQMKLYRSNGVSYQGKGVTPDIVLPYLETITEREQDMPYYIVGDSIPKKAIFPFPPAISSTDLNSKNNARIKSDERYKLLSKVSDSLRLTKDDDIAIRLTTTGFWQDMKLLNAGSDRIDQVGSYKRPGFDVYYNQLESEFLTYDANYQQLYNSYLEDLKTDLILQQVHDIMCDFIKQNPK
jgi:carboxyl-terminal processing protease